MLLKGRRDGFTLLEIFVALAVLGIALLVITRLFSANLRAITVSEDYIVAVTRAESRLRELLDDNDLKEKDWNEDAGGGYSIDASVKESLKKRSENLPYKLFEIAVSVHWKRWSRDKSVTLSTMKMAKKVL